jgi:hypothetical protein
MRKSQATPRPWKSYGVINKASLRPQVTIATGDETKVICHVNNESDAALMVRAVNLFEAHEAVSEAAIELDKVLALNGYNITGSKSLCNAVAQLAKLKEAQ